MFIRALATCGLFILVSIPLRAQSATGPAPATVAFDAADVHTSPPDRNLTIFANMQGGNLAGDRYILRQATMTRLIAAAYNLDVANVQGGPSWLDWDRYDIVAKAPPATSKEAIRLMLQSLLAQRFGLVVHTGTAPMPIYVLTAQKDKARLKASEGAGDPICMGQPQRANQGPGAIPQVEVICHNETMEKFAEFLQMVEGAYQSGTAKPVVDSTGLNGAYDLDLKWTPIQLLARAGGDGISLFDAMDKELGLKLTLETAPLPVLIVGGVNETPTPNLPDLDKHMPPLPPSQFDVAVIKPSEPGERISFTPRGDRADWRAITLKDHIRFAWDINFHDDESLVGAPKWLGEDRFDILAKFPGDDSAVAAPGAPQLLQEELRQMLRALIEDRFQMKEHLENRAVTAYHLIAAGPRLTPADPKARTRCDEGPGPDGKDPRIVHPELNRLLTCQNITMAQFGVLLENLANEYIYSPVLDDTGLKGSYNFTLSFSSIGLIAPLGGGAPPPDGAQQAAEPNGAISLFDAVKNQLGLKLEKQKRIEPVLVIDHIEQQPTAN